MTRSERDKRIKKPNSKPHKQLTLKQELFSNQYIFYKGNGTEAALHSYDTTSRRNAADIAQENLENPLIKQRIEELLELAGLGLSQLNDWSNAAVFHNLKYGKASQAAGISHLQFLYKLHNTLPASKKMSMNLNVKTAASSQNVNDMIKQAEDIASHLQTLISDFKK